MSKVIEESEEEKCINTFLQVNGIVIDDKTFNKLIEIIETNKKAIKDAKEAFRKILIIVNFKEKLEQVFKKENLESYMFTDYFRSKCIV